MPPDRRLRLPFRLDTRAAVVLAIALSIAGQFYLAVARQINWDEYYFLSRIHEYLNGSLGAALQTFHVHLFPWIALLPGTAADQIVVARLVMLGLETVTLCMVYLTATWFVSREAAAFAALAYASLGFVIVHGASFRFDPVATALLMLALWLLVAGQPSWPRAAVAGVAVAVAGLVTIKSVFYLPALLGACAWSLRTRRNRGPCLRAFAVGAVVAATAFFGLFELHSLAVAAGGQSGATETAASTVASSAGRVFDVTALLRTAPYLGFSILGSLPSWIAIVGGAAIAAGGRFRRRGPIATDRLRSVVLLSFAFPVVTLLFYRNSFPYYHVFALAPAAVLAGVAFEWLNWPSARGVRVIGAMAVLVVIHVAANASPGQRSQRTVLEAVHEIFGEPVAYIDRCSMVASFPKVGIFMSGWGIEAYREAGRPVLREAVASAGPRFVLANSPILEEALKPGTHNIRPGYGLLPADVSALRENYVHHWGPIWVAGKRLTDLDPKSATAFDIEVEGPYTLESPRPVLIDGRLVEPDGVVTLGLGTHEATATQDGVEKVVLRWGRHLPVPDRAPPTEGIFRGF